MQFSIFSLFKRDSQDQYISGSDDKSTIFLLDNDPHSERLSTLFNALGHSVIILAVGELFPSNKIYDQGDRRVCELIVEKLLGYRGVSANLFVSSDIDTKLREVVDVANSLCMTTSLLSFESLEEGGSTYRNHREGYDYPIVDRAYFVDEQLMMKVKSRNKGPSDFVYTGQHAENEAGLVEYKRYLSNGHNSACLVEDMPVEYFGWLVRSCSENNIKLFARQDLLKKADREKYSKFCQFLPCGAKYKNVLNSADICYQKDEGYFVKVNGEKVLYTSLPESLYPLSRPIEVGKPTITSNIYSLDLLKLSQQMLAPINKRKYKTLVLNLKRGDNLFGSLNWYPKLLGCDNHIIYRGGAVAGDLYASFGLPDVKVQEKIKALAKENGAPYYNIENGFLAFSGIALLNSAKSHSLLLDSKSMYFDGEGGSSVEDAILFSEELSSGEEAHVAPLIKRILTHNLSKYNHAPQLIPFLPGDNKDKVLIVDQRYADKSIGFAGASEVTFNTMLMDAHRENPNSDIIVKVHPDALTGLVKGHYDRAVENIPRVYLYAEDINPVCLLKAVGSVYAVSSQMGFEALMLGKDVYVYGKAIYGGWGLTNDRIQFDRRGGEHRTLLQLFKALYIDNVPYIDPITGERISIDNYLDVLMKVRGAGEGAAKLVNVGEGQLVHNYVTDQYYIEKNGAITLNTVLGVLYNLDPSEDVKTVVCNLKHGGQLPTGSELLDFVIDYYQGEIDINELEESLVGYNRLNDVFNLLKVFHSIFDSAAIMRITNCICNKSKSSVFLEKFLYWSIGTLAKSNRTSSSLSELVTSANALEAAALTKLTEFTKAVSA
jgi:hypothetical protein